MSELTLEVDERTETGKNANRRLRLEGKVPAVVYGEGIDPAKIQVPQRRVQDLLSSAGDNAVFLLKLAGGKKSRHAMIRELQVDTINGAMIHIDFQRIAMDRKVKVSVPILIQGEAEGVKNEAGFLDFVTREVDLECLPANIPGHLELDVSALHIGQHVEASELELPKNVTLLSDEERVIVSVSQAKQVEEEEVEEIEEEGLLTAEVDEPEVVGETEE